MLIRAATWMLVVVAAVLPAVGEADALPAASPIAIVQPTTISPTSPPTSQPTSQPPGTINDFLPEDRGIGECISALPKPGCGSESRGGWAQTAVLGAIVAGLAFIVWRIVVSARRAQRHEEGAPP